MKQDLKEISYNIKRETEDKNLIYTIDYLLYNEIKDRFNRFTMEYHKSNYILEHIPYARI